MPVFILAICSGLILTVLACVNLKLALASLFGMSFLIFAGVAPLFWLAVLLVILIPFHSLISELLGGYASTSRQIFAMWKEILIIIGSIRAFINNSNRSLLIKENPWILLFASALAGVYMITFLRLPSIPGIFSLNEETRFMGILIFFMLLPLDGEKINRLMQLMLFSLSLVALYGIVQYFWDYNRLWYLLYYAPTVVTEARRRVYSYCLNPFDPAYGPVIGIFIMLPICFRQPRKWLWGLPIVCLFISCLLLTYTRSGYLALIAGVTALLFFDRKYFRAQTLIICLALWIICAILLLGGSSLYESNLGKTLGTIVSQRDESSIIHKRRMEQAIDTILKSPAGIGLGKIGNVQARFQGGVEKAEYTENWILQVGVHTGIAGALIYISLNLAIFISLIKSRSHDLEKENHIRMSAFAALVGMTTAGILIPVWDFLLPVVYTWSLVGMALRTS